MKARLLLITTTFVSLLMVLLLAGCPSPVGLGGGGSDSPSATVTVNPSLGLAVLTEADGSETPVVSREGDENVACVDVTDYILFDDKSTSRHAGGHYGLRAIILGVRSDGRPGIWLIYPGGMVVVPESDDGHVTSELQEAISDADGFHWDAGWDYTALAMSSDARIFVGIAENPDANWMEEYLGVEPKVVVWWNLYKKSDGTYYISRARVVAEYPYWGIEEVKNNRRGRWRYHWYWWRWYRWIYSRLGLWFFGWADDFLGDLAGEDVLGEESPIVVNGDDTYGIYGYDKDGDFALATILPWKVLSIEKTELPGGPPENQPPYNLTAAVPTEFSTFTSGQTSQLYVDPTVGDPSLDVLDPDPGDDVTFFIVDPADPKWTEVYSGGTTWSLDPETGVITVPNLDNRDYAATPEQTFQFATTDGEYESDPFPVTFVFIPYSGG